MGEHEEVSETVKILFSNGNETRRAAGCCLLGILALHQQEIILAEAIPPQRNPLFGRIHVSSV